jgi:allantoicase
MTTSFDRATTVDHAALIAGRINLLDARLGAKALSCSDDFFAPVERLLNPHEPEWRAGVYDDHGKWMDGWESRRRRAQGHDHCIVQLAAPGRLAVLDIDTRFFTGNYPPYAAVHACRSETAPGPDTRWTPLLEVTPLGGNQRNLFAVAADGIWSHLKLSIFPDGGVARFRAYGTVHRDWSAMGTERIDLAAALHGGRALACSDEHYGAMGNLLLPGRGASMADGWETRRRREPGFDWVILSLGHPGRIHEIEVDTAHFKGNYPHQVSCNAAFLPDFSDADLTSQSLYWPTLLEPRLLNADELVRFAEVADLGIVSHVRVNMHPDGGMSRVRLFGTANHTPAGA